MRQTASRILYHTAMKPDEIVVARLNRGAAILQYVEKTQTRVTLALGRNKQAKLPMNRVLYATGVVPAGYEEFVEFRDKAEQASNEIDLSDLWEVVVEDPAPLSTDDMADLYYGDASPVRRAALILYLDRGCDYFVPHDRGYLPQTPEALQSLRERRRRETENAEAAETLMSALSAGTLPDPMSNLHENLLNHIRGFAVHGDDYARSYAAHSLLGTVSEGSRDLQRLAFDLLVRVGVFAEDEPIDLHRAEIEDRFPAEVVAEAESVRNGHRIDERDRADMTGLETFTIDDADTRDRDDALSLEVLDGGYLLGIHIADAGAFVPPNGAMNDEAGRRMATLYLPERTIPMLPSAFTNGVGSLDPDRVRAAVSLLVRIDESGDVRGYDITPSIVRSRDALSYEGADDAIENESNPWHETLSRMNRLSQALLARRERAGAINVNRDEMIIKVASSTDIEVRVAARNAPARGLVSEMMVLCNSLMADFCKNHDIPSAYRSQPPPDISDLDLFDENGVLRCLTPLQRYQLMRRLTPAAVGLVPTPHAGLGVDAYVQATSPLRRYPDLLMQRQISHYLATQQPLYPAEDIALVAQRAEVQLRELSRLEEGRRRYWFMKYLKITRLDSRDGIRLFDAYVLENNPRRPAVLDLEDYPFRIRAELPNSVEPGETVTLKLTGVNLWRRQGYFVHLPQKPANRR